VTTEELIIGLAQSAGPVRRLPPLAHRLVRWSVVALLALAALVLLIGVRPDVETASRQTAFVVLAALTLATSLTAASAALLLSVPGAARPIHCWMPAMVAGVWAMVLGTSVASTASLVELVRPSLIHVSCVIQIAGLALVPGWTLLEMIRQGAPMPGFSIRGLAALAALAVGAVGTQVLCPVDEPAHLLVGHLVPVVVLAAATAALTYQRTWKCRAAGTYR
jgi:hypothetical protein